MRLLFATVVLCLLTLPALAEPLPTVRATGVSNRYALGLAKNAPADLTDAVIAETVLHAAQDFNAPLVQVGFYGPGKAPGQGVMAVGETKDGLTVTIMRPKNPQENTWLEKMLAFPTSPNALSIAYLQNQVIADDDFQGKPVVFEATVGDIAKGAFNLPYIFFPREDGGDTGLTCYFPANSPNLRKITKGSRVLVRGVVKDFLMQDVILDRCEILSIK